jgi:chaperonin GroEL (HSP60 family)
VLESNSVVAGGGSVEMALFVYLDDYARTLGSREQLAVAEFAEALLIIPKVLALNAAKDATELLAKLRMYHSAAQRNDVNDEKKKQLKYSGLELMNGKVRDNLKFGVIEPAMSKVKSLRFATEAAVTIMRIDDSIKLAKPEQMQGGLANLMLSSIRIIVTAASVANLSDLTLDIAGSMTPNFRLSLTLPFMSSKPEYLSCFFFSSLTSFL